jgi:uncharacterized phage-associated protein
VGKVALLTSVAAKTAGEARGWTLSNLELQKLLYIAHMIHLGREQAPLVNETFEAWDYGPVLPSLYRQAKMFGKHPVKDIFYAEVAPVSSPEGKTIRDVAEFLASKPAAELIAITHWSKGAWAKHYQKGVRNIRIPNPDILQEYQDRMRGT